MAFTFGSPFLINTQPVFDQDNVSLAGLANGLFVAVYEAKIPGTFGNKDAIGLQIFNGDGSKRGGETNVTAAFPGTFFDTVVVAAPDGTFHLAFQSNPPGTSGDKGIGNFHRDIDGNAFAIGQVGNLPQTVDTNVNLAVRSDGGLFGVYASSNNPASADDPNIRGAFRIDDHQPAVGSHNTRVNSMLAGAQTRPDVAALDNGRFVTVWETGANVAFRFTSVTYGPDPNNPNNPDAAITTHLGADAFVAQGSRPTVAALPGGRFVVLWYNDGGGSPNRILGRVYDSNGNIAGAGLGDFVAATNVDRNAGADRDIAVTVLKNGNFVVAWTGLAGTNNADTSGTYVDAAVFNSKATPSTSPFTVIPSFALQTATSLTAITAGNQFDPTVAALADGRFVLGWTDASASAPDTSGLAVRGRVVDIRTNAVAVLGTAGHDDYIGTEFNDTLKSVGGPDKLTGAAGNDILDGGTGNDLLILGNGSDVVVYSTGYGADAVEDFANVEGDRIDLRALLTVHTFADVLARATQVGDDTVIDFGAGDTLTLRHVFRSNLTAADFMFSNPPSITSDGGGATATIAIAENTNVVTTVTATDPDFGAVLVFTITGGADQAKFRVQASSGLLAFIAGPDFEAPTDSDADNSYVVQVSVTDGVFNDAQTITVNVTDAIGLSRGPSQAFGPINDGFDARFYLSRNPDVAVAGVDPAQHYDQFGRHEGRDPNAWFDTAGYLARYADVAVAGVDPLQHFWQFGWREGRDPSARFDTLGYLAANPDVAAAHVNPLDHFLQFGIREGRTAVDDGLFH